MNNLSFNTLRKANIIRLPLFKNNKGELAHDSDDGSDWSDAEWLEAIVGELGEYANLKKKVRRGDVSFEDSKEKLSFELADVVIYLDILAHRLGIDLGRAVVDKFNKKSEENLIPISILFDDVVDERYNYTCYECKHKYIATYDVNNTCPQCGAPETPF